MHAADMLLFSQTTDSYKFNTSNALLIRNVENKIHHCVSEPNGHTSDSAQGYMTSHMCQEVFFQRHGKNRSLRIHISK